MSIPFASVADRHDRAALAELRARGIHANNIQSLARDQSPFARPTRSWVRHLAGGIDLTARPVDLGEGCFTNAYTLDVDLDRAHCRPVSSPAGYHLRSLVGGSTVAAVSGAFSFISDDPDYQPAEPCLDLAIRNGRTASLPTADKPAFLLHHDRPTVRALAATGTLTVAGHPHTWTGSKRRHPAWPGEFTVFGAGNCRIRYHDDPRTGFRRDVDPAANTTPRHPDALDCTITSTGAGLRIAALHPGGGTDLFTGAFVLRTHRPWPTHLTLGAPVHVTTLDTLDTADIDGALSLGPTAADAAAGRTDAWDQSLGTSPFRPHARYARTLLTVNDRRLTLLVLDGAPLTRTFQGATAQEAADLCARAGFDPATVFHLDGGQTSKIAYTNGHQADAVGSLHYLRWPRHPHQPFRWHGLDGRRLRSALEITTIEETR
ncbi:phosphodiester glycosidase family protein [Streptomyces sp. NPDC052042]|uniref:phosphodiester glycosidase family protein n=1 Tax=Streptomyces sp. NPDC052042 TaxID=3365683 RepID=UPI0037D8BBE2